jgi:hypothetical protein
MRKSQIAGQVFIYIMAAVIFGLVMIYGYKAISTLVSRGNDVALIQFRADITSAIQRISSSSDARRLELSIPSKFRQVCFVDSYERDRRAPGFDESPPAQRPADLDAVIYDSWADRAPQDVFLLPSSEFQIFAGNIEIAPPHYLCVNVISGRIALRLEGRGDHALVSQWQG